ncbi:MAG: ribulose-phosphate 3-epimerase, partial [Lachnospiraceae bacterium]|nr:ribulose-phosphate 3-epimerase [Lachnospiraceae bacterium]
FIPYSLDKLRRLREMAEERDLELEIGVDGGIGLENIASVLDAGANFIIAGSSVFSEKDKITEKMEAFNRFIKP